MNEEQQAASQSTQAEASASKVPVSQPSGALPQEPNADQKLEKVEREMSGFERSTLRWTRATFVILGVTCLFIAFQYKAMNRQLSELQIQTRLDERPWLKFKFSGEQETPGFHPSVDVALGGPIQIPTEFFNFGKTAALGVKGAAVIQIVKNGEQPTLPRDESESLIKPDEPIPESRANARTKIAVQELQTGAIYPNDHGDYTLVGMRCCVGNVAVPLLLEPDEFSALRDRSSYIAVWGQVWYSDVFGIDHWTKFCAVTGFGYHPESKACANYNDADRSYQPKAN